MSLPEPGAGLNDFSRQALERFAEVDAIAMSRTLLGIPESQASEILNALAPRLAARLLAVLPDSVSDRMVAGKEDRRLAELLAGASQDDALSIAGRLPVSRRQALVGMADELDHAAALRLRSVGVGGLASLLEQEYVRVLDTATVADLVAELSALADAADPIVCVCDDTGRYRGSIALHEALRAPLQTPVSDLLHPLSPLPLESTLEDAISLRRWDDHRTLPVTDRAHRLVGAVRFRRLKQALMTNDDSGPGVALDTPLRWLEVTTSTLQQLLQALLSRGT